MARIPRVAAFDYGKARIGVAVSDELGAFAHPRPPIAAKDRGRAMKAAKALVAAEEITHVLVGLPTSLSGHEGEAAVGARRFAQELANATGLDVELIDERLSTVHAKRELSMSGVSTRDQRQKIDGVAASLLLQSWLDGRRARG